jgi:hypothetical protein
LGAIRGHLLCWLPFIRDADCAQPVCCRHFGQFGNGRGIEENKAVESQGRGQNQKLQLFLEDLMEIMQICQKKIKNISDNNNADPVALAPSHF